MNKKKKKKLKDAASNVGFRIRSYRKKNKLSQKEFADKIGLSVSTLSNYENGNTLPDMKTLVHLSVLFNCTTDDLLDLNRFKFIEDPGNVEDTGIESVLNLLSEFRKLQSQAVEDNMKKLYNDKKDTIDKFQ